MESLERRKNASNDRVTAAALDNASSFPVKNCILFVIEFCPQGVTPQLDIHNSLQVSWLENKAEFFAFFVGVPMEKFLEVSPVLFFLICGD
jgi:hypothetical protein